MNYTITVSEDGLYIILTIVGTIGRRSAMPPNVEAHALGERLGIQRYLVDVTGARNREPAVDAYEFAHRDLAGAPLNRFARVALLVAPDDHSHDFVETVSRNAGHDVTLFRDRAAAVAHLLA